MQGQGTYFFANGDKYIGEWFDNKKHGEGICVFANGIKRIQTYFKDKLI